MFRIAPTPSGFLHIGNAYSFLLTEHLAKKENTKILLRIDDLDGERKRAEYVSDIFESMRWLDIKWDAGPEDENDFEAHWSQQTRISLYNDSVQRLKNSGEVFACECSRADLQAAVCVCAGKKIDLETPGTALRLRVPAGTMIGFQDEKLGDVKIDLKEDLGDFVIRKKDGNPAYQLTSVVDDLQFGTTYIVRGEDLLFSTAAQLFLAEKLGENNFQKIKFYHHPLLKDAKGNKLSKSAGSASLKSLREKGVTREKFIPTLNLPF